MTKKRLFLIIGSGIVILALAAIAVIYITAQIKEAQLTSDGQPTILYKKLVGYEDETAVYNLYLCSTGAQPQLLESGVRYVQAGDGGLLVGFNYRTDDYAAMKVYLMDSSGSKKLFEKGVFYFKISDTQRAIEYCLTDSLENLYIREYTEEGQLKSEETIEIGDTEYDDEVNFDAGLIAIVKNMRSGQEDWSGDEEDNPYEFNWGDLYVYTDGEMEFIAEKAFLSGMNQSVSDNGSIVYLAESDPQTKTGTLYMKEPGSAPQAVVSNATTRFAISRDGRLVAALTGTEADGYALFYRFANGTSGTIDNVSQFAISKSGDSLYYTVSHPEEWHDSLYCMGTDTVPSLLDNDMSLLIDVSNDGETVLYMRNYDADTSTGELYWSHQGQAAELIDSGVPVSYEAAFLGGDTIIISDDGSTVAYLKNVNTNWLYGDLCVKSMDEPIQMLDDSVSVNFSFWG
jgi:hypothetical protein